MIASENYNLVAGHDRSYEAQVEIIAVTLIKYVMLLHMVLISLKIWEFDHHSYGPILPRERVAISDLSRACTFESSSHVLCPAEVAASTSNSLSAFQAHYCELLRHEQSWLVLQFT